MNFSSGAELLQSESTSPTQVLSLFLDSRLCEKPRTWKERIAYNREALESNLTKIAECQKDLTETTEILTQRVSNYCQANIDKLQQLKNEFRAEIQDAEKEVEKASSTDQPVLTTAISKSLWNGGNLALFTYQIDITCFNEVLIHLLQYSLKPLPNSSPDVILMEQDWKPESVSPVSFLVLDDIPDMLTDTVKTSLRNLGPYLSPVEVTGGESKGPIELSDGSVYLGQWKSGKRFGKGKLYSRSGGYMEGYWNNGLHIHGRCIYPNGDFYEGGYCHMKRAGTGYYQDFSGTVSYLGDWKNGLKHGQGVEHLSDGSIYEGHFCKDKKNGYGVFQWPNQEVYVGHLKDMKLHGFGKYVWTEQKWYEGEWREGKMNGKGKHVQDGKVYEGEFLNDKKHGYGVLQWDGNVYEGEWVDGKMHGKGYLSLQGRQRKRYRFQNNKKLEQINE